MSGFKSNCERYRVSLNCEHATICLDTWSRANAGSERPTYGGEIMIHSSFGSYGHTWSNCGVPFKEFLLDISRDSFMTKCLGRSYMEFDGEASVASIRKAILTHRRAGEFDTAEEAREAWNDLESFRDAAESSEDLFFHLVGESLCTEESVLGEARAYRVDRPCTQAVGFWRELWPEFKAMLAEEVRQDVVLKEEFPKMKLEGWPEALFIAVTSLYFDENYDYKFAVLGVVKAMAPHWLAEMDDNPKELFAKSRMLLAASKRNPELAKQIPGRPDAAKDTEIDILKDAAAALGYTLQPATPV